MYDLIRRTIVWLLRLVFGPDGGRHRAYAPVPVCAFPVFPARFASRTFPAYLSPAPRPGAVHVCSFTVHRPVAWQPFGMRGPVDLRVAGVRGVVA
ncbi:hypothetical protein ACIBKZ_14980 [Streptomyces sp. NPDC050421]|uniref:hypothetical protein n=1 Tax=Streptomyces sp. NPDC050421 TaxID=3365613 RepID=UPI0037A5C147